MRERQNLSVKSARIIQIHSLSYYRPHRPTASTTVSRWLKYVLKSVGIYVSIYKGHSTRSATALAAKLKEVSASEYS